MRGVPQKAPGDLLGQRWGSRCPSGAICGHFWSPFWTPFGALGVKVAMPGAPLAPPWAPLAPLLQPLLQSVLHGCYFGCPGCRGGDPPGVEMWLKHNKYRCFAKVHIWSPRCQKGVPGVPRDVFLALFGIPLGHLGVPFAPRGHFEATLSHTCDPTCVLMHFVWILVSPGPPKKKSAARARRMWGCGKSTLWHLKCVFYLGFSTFGTNLRFVGSLKQN